MVPLRMVKFVLGFVSGHVNGIERIISGVC